MENKAVTRRYEMVVILDAKLNGEQKDAILKEITDVLQKFEAKVINTQVWIEKHKLAFDIKKRKEGTYYFVNFESSSSAVASVRGVLRLKENILRFVILKAE